jgi:capsid protein
MTGPDRKPGLLASARALLRLGRTLAVHGSFDNARRNPPRSSGRAPLAAPGAHRDRSSLDALIRDSQALARNDHAVRAMLAAQRDLVVGAHPGVEAATADESWNDRAEALFAEWAEAADPAGLMSLWDLAGDILTRCETDGGVLVHRVRADRPAVELVDAIRIRNRASAPDREGLTHGVETDGRGRVTGYWLARWSPDGTRLETGGEIFVPAGVAWLINAPRLLSAGQLRAEPGLSPIIDRLETLNSAWEAAMIAYETAASIGLAAIRDLADSPESIGEMIAGGADEPVVRGEAIWAHGLVMDFQAGTQLQQVKGEHPKMEFQEAYWMELQTLCASMDLPLELVFYRYIRNFHASRSAIATAWRRIERRQEWLARVFVRPLWKWFVKEEIAAGRLAEIEGWDRCRVYLAPMPVLDPRIEIDAVLGAIHGGLMTHEDGLMRFGYRDRAAFLRKRGREIGEAMEAGIAVGEMSARRTVVETVDETEEIVDERTGDGPGAEDHR